MPLQFNRPHLSFIWVIAALAFVTDVPAEVIQSGSGWAIHSSKDATDWTKLVAKGNLVAGKLVKPEPGPDHHNTESDLKRLTDGELAGREPVADGDVGGVGPASR